MSAKLKLHLISERVFIAYPQGRHFDLFADGAMWRAERIYVAGKAVLRYVYHPDVVCFSGEKRHCGKPEANALEAAERAAVVEWMKTAGEPARIETA